MKKRFIVNLQLFSEGSEGFEDTETTIPGSDEDFANVDETVEDEEEEFEETEEVEEETEETIPGDDVEPQPTEEQKIKIKYNKEEKELTLAEVQELAQKGMNYDKKIEELNSYQNNPGLRYMENLAAKNGVTVEELVNYYHQQEQEQEIQELINQNIPEEYAREMIESRKFREEQQKLISEQKAKVELETKQKTDFMDFIESFSDVKTSDIPQEVWEKVDQGMSLKQAYIENDYQRLLNENKILKQNKTNKQRAKVGGTANTGNDSGEQYDAFLDGFNSI